MGFRGEPLIAVGDSAPCRRQSISTAHLFHDPSALGAFTLPYSRTIASDSGAMKVQTGSAPATHLNVFTVEEYESNGKSGKRWTKVGAAFPHKEGSGFSIELSAIPLDGRLVVLPPADDDGRNGK